MHHRLWLIPGVLGNVTQSDMYRTRAKPVVHLLENMIEYVLMEGSLSNCDTSLDQSLKNLLNESISRLIEPRQADATILV